MVNALFDQGRRDRLRDAIRKGDASIFRKQAPAGEPKESGPTGPQPLAPDAPTPAMIVQIPPPQVQAPPPIQAPPPPAARHRRVVIQPPPQPAVPQLQQSQLDRQLLVAIRQGAITEVGDALARGANPNAKDAAGTPAIVIAAEAGNADIIQHLAKCRADVNAQDSAGRTALMVAAVSRNPETVSEILSLSPKLDFRDNEGRTALMLTVCGKSRHRDLPRIAKMLLDAGADADIADMDGSTPLIKAAMWSPWSVVRAIGEKCAVNHQNNRGFTALMMAVKQSDDTAVSTLLDLGADPNPRSKEGYDALSYAIESNSITIAQTLLVRGAAVDVTYNDGYTALQKARVLKKRDFVKLLKKHRAAE